MNTENSVIAAFTIDQAERLTGISRNQLISWHKKGFFSPAFADDNTRQAYSRLYSFLDLACLRVLNVLRNESRIPFSELEQVKENLNHLGEHMWAKTTLYVLNRKVVFDNPETNAREEVNTRQKILNIPLKVVTGELRKDIEKIHQRDVSKVGKIERKRGISQGHAIIAGTRIRADLIKEFSEAGCSIEEILQKYPSLQKEDVIAAINYKGAA